MLEVRVSDERGRSAVHAVKIAGQRGDPQPIVRLRNAGRHLIAGEGVLPEREIVEDGDMATVADELQRVRPGIGDIRTTVGRQDAVRVRVVLLVRDVGDVVEAEGAYARDLVPRAVRLHREQRAGLLLGSVDICRAFGVPGGALVVREGLRKDAKDRHQRALTRRNPGHSQGLALVGIEELGG